MFDCYPSFCSDSTASVKSLSHEQSAEVIHLDNLRTFPTLAQCTSIISCIVCVCVIRVIGSFWSVLFVCVVLQVQGMLFLPGVLLFNMEAADDFICLANLFNRPSYLAFFRVEQSLVSLRCTACMQIVTK